MRTADFDYVLPAELIAQAPTERRGHSRMLVLDRAAGSIVHASFDRFSELLTPGDCLVMNDSRVIPARLRGRNERTGGEVELLLLEENALDDWWAMVKPAKRARVQASIRLDDRQGRPTELLATVIEVNSEGHRRLKLCGAQEVGLELDRVGEVPLPPYIKRSAKGPDALDRERYQTVYARERGSIAAPTAGLHFTGELLDALRGRGVRSCFVTLHVGVGTFAPVKAERLADHRMHPESFAIPEATAAEVNQAKQDGRRVIAVGTTTLRVLESAAGDGTKIEPVARGRTALFIHPPWRFRGVDALLTNFHLPRSTLLMLVSAFAAPGATRGRDLVLSAYGEAIRAGYRFYSYGDAMFLS